MAKKMNMDDNTLYINQEISKSDVRFQEAYKYIDDLLFSKITGDYFVAGGFLRKFLNKEEWLDSDIDVYFMNSGSLAKFSKSILEMGYKVVFDSKNSTLYNLNGQNIDCIKRSFKRPDVIISEFDFTVCCCAISQKFVHYRNDLLEDLSTRSININTILYPNTILSRLQKYIQKGYIASRDTLHEIGRIVANGFDTSKNTQEDYSSPRENRQEPLVKKNRYYEVEFDPDGDGDDDEGDVEQERQIVNIPAIVANNAQEIRTGTEDIHRMIIEATNRVDTPQPNPETIGDLRHGFSAPIAWNANQDMYWTYGRANQEIAYRIATRETNHVEGER